MVCVAGPGWRMAVLRRREFWDEYVQHVLLKAFEVSSDDFKVKQRRKHGGSMTVTKLTFTAYLKYEWYARFAEVRSKKSDRKRGKFGQRVTLRTAEIKHMAPIDIATFGYGLKRVSLIAEGPLKELAAQMGQDLLDLAAGVCLLATRAPGFVGAARALCRIRPECVRSCV